MLVWLAVLAAVFWTTGFALVLAGQLAFSTLLNLVNARLPADHRIAPQGWHFLKYQRLGHALKALNADQEIRARHTRVKILHGMALPMMLAGIVLAYWLALQMS